MRSRGVFCAVPSATDHDLRCGAVEDSAAEDPRSVRQGVWRVDFAALGGQAQGLGTDLKIRCGLAQIEPRLLTLLRRTIDRDLVMRSQRRHAFPGPAIATARGQLVAIENTGNLFIIGDQDKLSNGGDDVL